MRVIQKAASCLRGTINISASRVAVTRQRDASHRRALYIPVVVAFATNTYNSSLVSVTNFSLNGSTNSSIMFAGDCAAVAINISRENALRGTFARIEAENVEMVPDSTVLRGGDVRWKQGAESHVDTRYGNKKLLYWEDVCETVKLSVWSFDVSNGICDRITSNCSRLQVPVRSLRAVSFQKWSGEGHVTCIRKRA